MTTLSLDEAFHAGLREVVIGGGAHHAGLVAALSAWEEAHPGTLRLWTHFDERSAAFFALGRAQNTGHPVAVLVTSGTAVAECLPAVLEAEAQQLPLLILSAARLPAHHEGGSPQALDQHQLFGTHAHSGPASSWDGRRPWHLDLPLDEGQEVPLPSTLGTFQPERLTFSLGPLRYFLEESPAQPLLLILGGLEPSEREETYHFARQLRAPVLAEAQSGLREALATQSLCAPDAWLARHPPAQVLRLGQVPSGRFWRDLEHLPEVDVFSLSRQGLPGLARCEKVQTLRGEVDRILRGLGKVPPRPEDGGAWHASQRRLHLLTELREAYPESEPSLLATFSLYAATGESLYLGNSLALREWNDFAHREIPLTNVRASRGLNGIDGQLATWLGGSADEHNAWALVGDLTALYDFNAPHFFPQLQCHGRVLGVVNNGGGRIFERLPRLTRLPATVQERLIQPHQRTLQPWAQLWDCDHLAIRQHEDFDALDERPENPRPLIVEMHPDPDQTHAFWAEWEKIRA